MIKVTKKGRGEYTIEINLVALVLALLMAIAFFGLLQGAYFLAADAFDKSYANHDRMIENHKVSLEYEH